MKQNALLTESLSWGIRRVSVGAFSKGRVPHPLSVISSVLVQLVMSLLFNLTNLGAIYPGNVRRPCSYSFCLLGGLCPGVLILAQAVIDYLGFIRDVEFSLQVLRMLVRCSKPHSDRILVFYSIQNHCPACSFPFIFLWAGFCICSLK